jgi:hypothetical protein
MRKENIVLPTRIGITKTTAIRNAIGRNVAITDHRKTAIMATVEAARDTVNRMMM